MKKIALPILIAVCVLFTITNVVAEEAASWIRVNHLGYLPASVKVAVFVSKGAETPRSFQVCDALTGEPVFASNELTAFGEWGPFESAARLDFSGFSRPGGYYVEADGVKSPPFRIGADVYDGAADFMLRYMRQQRCGYNPFLGEKCHTQDGFVVYGPEGGAYADSTVIDVTGGWHDATDYLQYLPTSATAVHQMLLAWKRYPSVFRDSYDAAGDSGANGVPDILDEAKWGLDWMLKMNPEKDVMFNQIADDRDHAGFRLPTEDQVDYGMGPGGPRPVYFVNGEPQGLLKYKNHTRGVSSTAGKFASSFALGAAVFNETQPDYAATMAKKAVEAFEYGERLPGYTQTAPGTAPYFYDEENWVDDMELAAAELGLLTGDNSWFERARHYGRREPVTPWMTDFAARHYQWYPFYNAGHPILAGEGSEQEREEFAGYMRWGLDFIKNRGEKNPFLMGVPFLWCSNNFVSATLSQCILYREISGDNTYREMEAALIDWLFGVNPWGTGMVPGLPAHKDVPVDTHSSLSLVGMPLDGGLVDGPIWTEVFKAQLWITLGHEDEYAPFQSDLVVYHDDFGDYSTNEPTMDGCATLIYPLAALENEGKMVQGSRIKDQGMKTSQQNSGMSFISGSSQNPAEDRNVYDHGGIVRTDPSKKTISLVFSAHTFVDGYDVIKKTLRKHNAHGTFFFTGVFYRTPEFAHMVEGLLADGHYVGAHSDKHILYAPWENRDSTLVDYDTLISDVAANYKEMARFGISKEDAPIYMPPYEWYNSTHSAWLKDAGITMINLTPATWLNQDWTIPDSPDFPYYSSDDLLGRLAAFEAADPNGLAGTILLVHFGTDPRRTDKLYNRLDTFMSEQEAKGYRFTSLKEAIGKW